MHTLLLNSTCLTSSSEEALQMSEQGRGGGWLMLAERITTHCDNTMVRKAQTSGKFRDEGDGQGEP